MFIYYEYTIYTSTNVAFSNTAQRRFVYNPSIFIEKAGEKPYFDFTVVALDPKRCTAPQSRPTATTTKARHVQERCRTCLVVELVNWFIVIIIDRFYIALFSARKQTHCARM